MKAENNKVGEMKLSKSLMERATDIAKHMHQDKLTTASIDLFDEADSDTKSQGVVSTSSDGIRLTMGSFTYEGKIYYIGFPKNGKP